MVVSAEVKMRLIEYGKFRIVIMDAPCDENSHLYVKELKACGVTDVVRTCEPTYSPELFEKMGIKVSRVESSERLLILRSLKEAVAAF
eukprot:symbB.v1.2.018395.t1/scaffold1460.1/size117342/7